MKIRFTTKPKKNDRPKVQYETTKKHVVDTFQCPYCEQIITIQHNIKGKYTITCPTCGHKGVIINDNNQDQQKTLTELPAPSWFHQPYLRSKIIGLLFIAIGFILLINPTSDTFKISITLFFIGGLLFTLISEKKFIIMHHNKPIKTKSPTRNLLNANRLFLQHNKLVVSEKITLLIITATMLLFLITNPAEIEIFLVLLYLSLLIIKELIDDLTPVHVKKRLNYFIVIFFIIFIAIIAERIITILNI